MTTPLMPSPPTSLSPQIKKMTFSLPSASMPPMSSIHRQWIPSHVSRHLISPPTLPRPQSAQPPPYCPCSAGRSSNMMTLTPSPFTLSQKDWCPPSKSVKSSTNQLLPILKIISRVWRRRSGTTLIPSRGAPRTMKKIHIPDSQSQLATVFSMRSSGSNKSIPNPSHVTLLRMAPAQPLTFSESTPNQFRQPIQWNLYQPGSVIPSWGPLQPFTPCTKLHRISTTGVSRWISTATATLRMPTASPWLRPRSTRPMLTDIGSLEGYAKPSWKQCTLLPVSLIWKGSRQPCCCYAPGQFSFFFTYYSCTFTSPFSRLHCSEAPWTCQLIPRIPVLIFPWR